MSSNTPRLHAPLGAGLHWVRGELEQSLTRARQLVEQHAESPDDSLPLQQAVTELHQARGTASMIQCYGFAALAEEMKQTLQDLIQPGLPEPEIAYSGLMSAAVQLADYIDALSVGFHDCALVLQPVINELRLVRGKSVVTEQDLFVGQLNALAVMPPAPDLQQPEAGAAQAQARRLLPAYQTALLQWLRNQDTTPNLSRLGKIAEHVSVQAADPAVYQLWRALAGCVEALLTHTLEDSLDLKRLFGRAGQLLKILAESGGDAAAAQTGDLVYQLLFHVGRSRGQGPRVSALRKAYRLQVYLPPTGALDELRRRLRGPTTQLLDRVASEIRSDLVQIKDSIDLAVRAGTRSAADLAPTRERLTRVSNTLSVLGLPVLQRVIANQARVLENLQPGEAGARQTWMDFATAVLRVEHSLEDALFRQLRTSSELAPQPLAPRPELDEDVPHLAGLREGVAALLRESLVNLAKLKAHVDAFLKTGDTAGLAESGRMLNEVASGFRILDRERAAQLLDQLRAFLQSPAFATLPRNPALADRFADAVAGVEFFIEAQRDGLPLADQLLDDLTGLLERLDAVEETSAEEAAATAAPPAPDLVAQPVPEPLPGEPPVEVSLSLELPSAPLEATPAPEPAAPAPAAAPPPVQLEIDPEFREIFLEEAVEVLQTLQRALPSLRREPGDRDTLTEIRRAFHTLKGSGRMVGAVHIGDFGWALESLLNRCLDGALEPGPKVVDTVRTAVDLLPALIERFREGQPQDPAVARLCERAHNLAAGRDEAGEPDIAAVFRNDGLDRLKLIARWLEMRDRSRSGPDGAQEVPQEVVRAFHTLRGAAFVVNAPHIGETAGAVETWLDAVRGAELTLGGDGLQLLDGIVAQLREWVLKVGQAGVEPPDARPWLVRIEQIQAAVPQTAVQAVADRQLAEVFANEAFDLVQKLEELVGGWSRAPDARFHVRDLRAVLHTLKGAALMASCAPLANAAQALYQRMEEFEEGPLPTPAFFRRFQQLIEAYYQSLDRYREDRLAGDGAELSAMAYALNLTETGAAAAAVAAELPAPAPAPPVAEPAPPQPEPVSAAAAQGETIVLSSLLLEPAQPPAPAETAPAPAEIEVESFDLEGAFEPADAPPPAVGPQLDDIGESVELHFEPSAPEPEPEFDVIELSLADDSLAAPAAAQEAPHTPPQAPPAAEPGQNESFFGVGFEPAALLAEPAEMLLLPEAEPAEPLEPVERGAAPADAAPFGPELSGAQLQDVFLAEAAQLLEQVDQYAATLEAEPQNLEAANQLRATLHGLKGNARVAGFPAVSEVAQRLESFVLAVITGSQPADTRFFARLQNGADGMLAMLDQVRAGSLPDAAPVLAELELAANEQLPQETDAEEAEALFDRLSAGFAAAAAPPAAAEPPALPQQPQPSAVPAPAAPAPALTAEIDRELAEIFSAEAAELLESIENALSHWRTLPGDDSAMRDVQRALHTLKGGARMAGLSVMGSAAHDMETHVNAIEQGRVEVDDLTFARLGVELEQLHHMHDLLVRGDVASLMQAAPAAAPSAAPAESPVAPPPAAATAAWDPQLFWKPEDEQGQAAPRRETARVAVESLDTMLNEAGEISIYRSRLEEQNTALQVSLNEMTQTIARLREQLRQMDMETEAQIAARGLLRSGETDRYESEFDPLEMDRYSRMQELSRALAESVGDLASLHLSMDEVVSEGETLLLQQGRVNTSVQTGLMGTLMVPFSRQVQRLQRVVRQVSQEHGKRVEVQFSGIESELDRNVLERMTAPLEHLLRNSIVHGIEAPEARAAAGKDPEGRISVSLRREGTQLFMELRDDGRGLDIEAIRDTATRRGLVPEGAQLRDEDIAQFIFAPGFSTARSLTQDAGRGVGMDVVASEVKQLGGTLELGSEPGRGIRFLIRLPLTLAISQALLVQVGDELYAIPLPSIEGIARIPRDRLGELYRDSGTPFAYGGQEYRVRYLGDYVGSPRRPELEARTVSAILVRVGEGLGSGDRRVAVVVDKLLGNRDVVSKAVGPQVSSVIGVSGATILADGRVVLILDVAALAQDRARRALMTQAARAVTATHDERDLVMVVDDSITMRRVAERLLTRNGFRVSTAKDGLDAMARLQTESPVAVLLDIEMPRADGFEVAAFIRNTGRIARTPIIMITSRSGEKHRDRARSLGVNRYLIKPYQEDQLMSEVRSVIAESSAVAA